MVGKILRETDVCPFCFRREGLFEVVDNDLIIDGWGCHDCQFFRWRGHPLPAPGGEVEGDWPFKQTVVVRRDCEVCGSCDGGDPAVGFYHYFDYAGGDDPLWLRGWLCAECVEALSAVPVEPAGAG